MTWKFSNDKKRVVLDSPPKKTLKLTATRLGGVLGLNPYATDFEAWCEITKTYKKPFEDNKYTLAGKAIEPIIIQWCKDNLSKKTVAPEELYGNRYKELKYDFYLHRDKIFGGMWDCAVPSKGSELFAVIEIKTSGRPQDWIDGVPMEKLVQALQYGHLEKAKYTYVVVAFMTDDDYARPEEFKPVMGENMQMYRFETETHPIMVFGEMMTISDAMRIAVDWWRAYVSTGVSPDFDEKRDAHILKELRTQRPDEDEDSTLVGVIKLVESLEAKLETARVEAGMDSIEEQLKNAKDALKRLLTDLMGVNDEKVAIGKWLLSRQEKKTVDTDAMKKDGIYEKYLKTSTSMVLRQNKGEAE